MVLIGVPGLPQPTMSRVGVRRAGIRWLRRLLSALQPVIGSRGVDWHTRRFGSKDYLAAGELRSILVRIVNEDLTESAQLDRVPDAAAVGHRRYRDAALARAPLPGDHRCACDARFAAAQGSLSLSSAPARTCAAIKIRGWLNRSRRCLSFWPWMPIVAAAQTYPRRGVALLALSALLPAGRVRASALSPVGERSLAHRSGVLAVDRSPRSCSSGRRRWRRSLCSSAGAVLLGIAQPDPRRSGKIHAEDDVARHARADRRDGVRVERVGRRDQPLRRRPSFGRRSSPSTVVFAVAAARADCRQRAPGARTSAHVQRRLRARGGRPHRATSIRSSSASRAATGRAARKSMLAHILQFDGADARGVRQHQHADGHHAAHPRGARASATSYMVVEMGAFKTGSIRRLCQLTPPSAGLITAVGDMHLERFGSTDEIVQRQERAGAGDSAGRPARRQRRQPGRAADRARPRRIAACCCTAKRRPRISTTRSSRSRFSKQGTTFVLRTQRADVRLLHAAPRPADHPEPGRRVHARDGASAWILRLLVAALRTLKPVSNRLEVVEERGVTWIRDAYNSNQFGFRAALEVAAALPVAAPISRDAGRDRARAGAVRRQSRAVDAKPPPSATTRSSWPTPTARRSSPAIGTPGGKRAGAGAEPARGVPLAARDAEGRRRRHSRKRSAGSLRADRRACSGRADARRHERSPHRRGAVRRALARARRVGRERLADSPRVDPDASRRCRSTSIRPRAGGSARTSGTRDTFKGGGPDRSRLTEVTLSPGFGTSTLDVPVASRVRRRSGARVRSPVDVFVPVLHGTFGEDGCIQGLLDLGGCAYVGCGVARLGDRHEQARDEDRGRAGGRADRAVAVVRARGARPRAALADANCPLASAPRFGWPVIVKPCNLGSSAGVTDRGVGRRTDRRRAEGVRIRRGGAHRAVHQESAGAERRRGRARRAGRVGHRNAGHGADVAAVVQREIQASGTKEHRLERGHGRRAARARPRGPAGGDARATRSAMRRRCSTALGCEGISRIDFLIDADTNRAVLQRDQHAARLARVLSLVCCPALLDDHGAARAPDRSSRAIARDEARPAAQTTSGIAVAVLRLIVRGARVLRAHVPGIVSVRSSGIGRLSKHSQMH